MTEPAALAIAVLYGGISAEREVSLASGAQVIGALRRAGHRVRPILADRDFGAVVAALSPAPDVVFNALHGRYGEDGAIQGVLDWMGIPYTHSPARASALAMDKQAARGVFAAAGLPIAQGVVLTPAALAAADPLPPPYVVKPLAEGSSVGVEILRPGDGRRAAVAGNWRHGPALLAEEYVPGRELTVGVLGDRALCVTDITPAGDPWRFYDYAAKYQAGGSRHALPASLHPQIERRAMEIAVAAHRALGCAGATRADFRYDDTAGEPGRLALLEVNTQPGLTATSLLPEQAAHCGIGFVELCEWMAREAACRA